MKRIDLNADAYKILNSYHYKTHFKAAREVAENENRAKGNVIEFITALKEDENEEIKEVCKQILDFIQNDSDNKIEEKKDIEANNQTNSATNKN